jgi:hypothetical protein
VALVRHHCLRRVNGREDGNLVILERKSNALVALVAAIVILGKN